MQIQKNWRIQRVNIAPSGNDATDVKSLFIEILNSIVGIDKGFGIAWVSDGKTYGEADEFTDIAMPSHIVTPSKDGSGPRSWIVLWHNALGYQLCIEFDSYNYGTASFFVSPVAFSGGSLERRPMAPEEAQINLGPWVAHRGGQGGDYSATVALADDGSVRVIIDSHREGQQVMWLFDRLESGDIFTAVFTGSVAQGQLISKNGCETGFIIHEVAGSQVLAERPIKNEISDEHMLFPVGIFSGGHKIGYVDDMWVTPCPPAKTGDILCDGKLVVISGNVFPCQPPG